MGDMFYENGYCAGGVEMPPDGNVSESSHITTGAEFSPHGGFSPGPNFSKFTPNGHGFAENEISLGTSAGDYAAQQSQLQFFPGSPNNHVSQNYAYGCCEPNVNYIDHQQVGAGTAPCTQNSENFDWSFAPAAGDMNGSMYASWKEAEDWFADWCGEPPATCPYSPGSQNSSDLSDYSGGPSSPDSTSPSYPPPSPPYHYPLQPSSNPTQPRQQVAKFIRSLLDGPEKDPKLVSWYSKDKGIFRVVDSRRLANRWGQQKNRPNMTFAKMARGIRERRKAGDFDHLTVEEARRLPRRLIFKFGPKLLK